MLRHLVALKLLLLWGHWRLSEELFLFWYILLKDNMAMVEEFVEEVNRAIPPYQ
jgi:hypothetical protein